MGQIHSALAYYWDHKETLDADIEQRWQWAEQARQEAGNSPLVAKLRAQGLVYVISTEGRNPSNLTPTQ